MPRPVITALEFYSGKSVDVQCIVGWTATMHFPAAVKPRGWPTDVWPLQHGQQQRLIPYSCQQAVL